MTRVWQKKAKSEAMTLIYHVDYLEVLHKDQYELNMFSQYLSKIYGNKPKVHRGKMRYYLVMDMYYSEIEVVNFR